MNNKKIFSYLCVCLLLCFASVEAQQDTQIELRVAAFFPKAKRFRQLYGNIGTNYQVEVSQKFLCNQTVWANIDWFDKQKSAHSCYKTHLQLFNASIGIKCFYPLCNQMNVYLGVGPGLGHLHLKDKSCCRHRTYSKLVPAAVFKSGITYTYSCWLTELFVDYVYQTVNMHHRSAKLGGVKAGLGIGIQF